MIKRPEGAGENEGGKPLRWKMVPIGVKGRILQGERTGWYILVQDDSAETGGYSVLTSSVPGFNGGLGEGYDDWVENEETLALLFEERGWIVEWEP